MKTGDLIELEMERMSFGAAAVGRYRPSGSEEARPMVVFIEGAAPGERVKARLTRNHKTYWEAEILEILTPSPERVTPPCPVFGTCGGCQWQHLSYSAQLNAKQEILLHQLSRSTKIATEELKKRLTVHPAPRAFGYRARLQVHGDAKGLGFYASYSHDIAHTDRCIVAHPDIQKAWDDFVRYRPLKELAKATGQFKVEWTRAHTGLVQEALNRKHGFLGFTQINPEQNDVLVDLVSSLIRPDAPRSTLLDLYGGDGNLSKKSVDSFRHIFVVDSYNQGIAAPAIDRHHLASGQILIKEQTEEFLLNQRWRDWGFPQIDAIIADPPRNGLQEAASRICDLRASRVVLVSCDPSTLARDLTKFTSHYDIEAIHLIDMFPQTFHIETAVALGIRDPGPFAVSR